jgi:hypothetical protein
VKFCYRSKSVNENERKRATTAAKREREREREGQLKEGLGGGDEKGLYICVVVVGPFVD